MVGAASWPKGSRSPPCRSSCKIGCGSTPPTTADTFSCPGLIVLIMTLIGALLTALVMAREWERGTLEALFVTPVAAGEILLGKTIPYFVLGMIGLALCVVAAEFLFHVPLRGSILVLTGVSMLYLLAALGIGLLISSVTRNQFVASQVTLLATFLPALMLSGFLFDLRSMPVAVRAITYVMPARYFVALLQTLFLAGNVWSVILPNTLVLAGHGGWLVVADAPHDAQEIGLKGSERMGTGTSQCVYLQSILLGARSQSPFFHQC